MITALWLTDLHLDFVDEETWERLIADCRRHDPECILLTGDIATSRDARSWLRRLSDTFPRPIYFVLGNHDYYQSSILETEQMMDVLCENRADRLHRLDGRVIRLTPTMGLVGCGGWGDGRAGAGVNSNVDLSDFEVIEDLSRSRDKAALFKTLARLGDRAADLLKPVLKQALAEFPHVIVLTHVPPFMQAAWHQGRPSDSDFAPHFTCIATGQVLLDAARRHRNKRITVFCGHTHSPGFHTPIANLEVHTGGADYGRPCVNGLIQLEPNFSVSIPRPGVAFP
ncbi:MAG: metallophosphoesterase [Verrucomicrobia bacterium]|nr:metallophosphoesterase [Verrucomicrobiota bacterium]